MSEFVMLDYIHETQETALKILENSEKICQVFAEGFAEKKYRRVILTASGTSYNACVTAKYYMEKMLRVPCVPATSYAFAHYEETFCPDSDLMVAVTQEGESTNTIDALKKANELGIDNFVVTEYLNNTCTQTARKKVTIDCGREFVGPKTKGYTCTVLTLYLMALEAAKAGGLIENDSYEENKKRLFAVLSNINSVIEKTKVWFEKNKDDFIKCEKCYVLGYGANVGTAMEGALKSMETVRYPYFWFETEEFLHGPLASVKPDVYAVLIAPKTYGYDRVNELFKIMHGQNTHVYSIGAQEGVESDHVLDGGFVNDEDFSTLEYCVPLQLMAYLTYTARGIDLNVRNYPRTRDLLPTKAKPPQR